MTQQPSNRFSKANSKTYQGDETVIQQKFTRSYNGMGQKRCEGDRDHRSIRLRHSQTETRQHEEAMDYARAHGFVDTLDKLNADSHNHPKKSPLICQTMIFGSNLDQANVEVHSSVKVVTSCMQDTVDLYIFALTTIGFYKYPGISAEFMTLCLPNFRVVRSFY